MSGESRSEGESATDSVEFLISCSGESEQEILEQILQGGYDQGCFLRPSADQLLTEGGDEVRAALLRADGRERADVPGDDPFGSTPVPAGSIDGEEDGYAILNQRCDLVRSFADEPFVELASVRRITDERVITRARLNSPRLICLTANEDCGWILDLRDRRLLPKQCLLEHEVVLPVEPGRQRRDLALRIGQRYSRDAVPDDITREFAEPLAKWLKGSGGRRRRTDLFAELLVERQSSGDLLFIGVIAENQDRAEAEPVFRQWIENFQDRTTMTIAPNSGAATADDISLGLWKSAHKLDLDDMSRSSRAAEDAGTPNR